MVKTKTINSRITLFGKFVSTVQVELTIAILHPDNICVLKSYWVKGRDGYYVDNETIHVPGGMRDHDNWYWDRLANKLARKEHLLNFYEQFKNWLFYMDTRNSDVTDDIDSWN